MKKIVSAFLTIKEKLAKRIEQWHMVAVFFIVYDVAVVVGAYFLALWLRFDCRYSAIPYEYLSAWMMFSPIYAVVSVLVFYKFHLYQSIWRFVSFIELEKITVSSVILGLFHAIGITCLFTKMPITYYIVGVAIQFLLIVFVRFVYRFVLLERSKWENELEKAMASRVMMIGAGTAGQMILRDLHGAKDIKNLVCCIIDDDRNKWGRFIDGVPIVGGRDTILLNVEKYRIEKIFLTLPSATAQQRRDILDICKETNCELKIVPSRYALVASTKIDDCGL